MEEGGRLVSLGHSRPHGSSTKWDNGPVAGSICGAEEPYGPVAARTGSWIKSRGGAPPNSDTTDFTQQWPCGLRQTRVGPERRGGVCLSTPKSGPVSGLTVCFILLRENSRPSNFQQLCLKCELLTEGIRRVSGSTSPVWGPSAGFTNAVTLSLSLLPALAEVCSSGL